MTFVSPIWLLGLLPVAAAAVLTFVRPARRELVVGSLALWQKAAGALGVGGTRPVRCIPPGWAPLLLGATLAVLALVGPVWNREPDVWEKGESVRAPRRISVVTFDAIAGEIRPDGQAEIFVRLRNHSKQNFHGSFSIRSAEATHRPFATIDIPPEGTVQMIQTVPDLPAFTIRVINDTCVAAGSANLRKLQPGLTRVATLGDVSPVLHRFIQSDARLTLVTDVAQADVVLSQGVNPPKDTAGLILASPTPPPGWREGKRRFAVTLGQTDAAGDDSVMKDVNVAAMAVRRMQLWRPGGLAAGKALLRMGDEAVIVRTTPENDPSSRTPRRVYVAFAITPDNTNIENLPGPFVTLLANALRWLHPAGDVRGRYVRDDLIRGAFKHTWHLQERMDSKSSSVPVGASRNVELRPWLIVAAMLCWISGWCRCGRKAV